MSLIPSDCRFICEWLTVVSAANRLNNEIKLITNAALEFGVFFLLLEHKQRQGSQRPVVIYPHPSKMLRMPCSSLLIHLAKTLVSLLTESSQLFGLTSLSASIVANSKRFFPDIGPTVLKRRFIRHKALTFHAETFFSSSTEFLKCFAHLRKFQSLLSSSTNQFSLLMCPRGV